MSNSRNTGVYRRRITARDTRTQRAQLYPGVAADATQPLNPSDYPPAGGGFTAYPYGQQHLDRQFAGMAAAKLGGVLQ